jgi:hypothetical protein
MAQPQSQHFADLPHRQFLPRHPDLLLLSKRSTLPSVEDCQRPTSTPTPSNVITITGFGDHDPPEPMITIKRNA